MYLLWVYIRKYSYTFNNWAFIQTYPLSMHFLSLDIYLTVIILAVNPLYTETRYNDKIRYNDNFDVTKHSLKRCQLRRNYARILHENFKQHMFWIFVRIASVRRF